MAAWLQKRLKDAEALLEQADRTAQRVVKDNDNPKTTLTGVPAGPGAGALRTQIRATHHGAVLLPPLLQ